MATRNQILAMNTQLDLKKKKSLRKDLKKEEAVEEEEESKVPKLADICSSSIATSIFKSKIRWRKLTDLAFEFRYYSDDLKVPNPIRKSLLEAMDNVLAEAKRWNAKHLEMFIEPAKSKRRALPKSELLRTFYSHLIFKQYSCEIDDVATCSHLISTECKNWPLMQFQFACLYAKTELIYDDWKFNKYRLSCFRKQVGDHPVYDFWLTMMASLDKDRHFFGSSRRLPNQKVSQCFLFAIRNGYLQLVEYIWSQLSDRDRESIGLIEWRNMCLRARDGPAISFLCENLCKMNALGTCRIAWAAFFDAFQHLIHNEQSDDLEKNQFRRKFGFLMKHACPTLRERLVRHHHFRLICDAFRYNEQEIFTLLLDSMSPDDVASAREHIDRIFDRNKTKGGDRLRRSMVRRQQTVQ
uniref:Uncharacterized protein n=2 Tax=Caenorhabditis japonica TaxID=281687 RepID=A0A8R1HU83_CAEJA